MGLNEVGAANKQRDLTSVESIARQIISEINDLEVREAGLKDSLSAVQADLYRLRGAREGMSQGHQLAESHLASQAVTQAGAVVGRPAF